MNLHREFINKIILKRQATLIQFLDGEDSLNLSRFKPDFSTPFWNELDSIFFTIDFLRKNDLILVDEKTIQQKLPFLIGFNLDSLSVEDMKYTIHYFVEKLKISAGWKIESLPGLITFKNNNYQTDSQRRDNKNFWFTILIAISSPFLTVLAPEIFSLWKKYFESFKSLFSIL